jgi:hypothetical protein
VFYSCRGSVATTHKQRAQCLFPSVSTMVVTTPLALCCLLALTSRICGSLILYLGYGRLCAFMLLGENSILSMRRIMLVAVL